MSSREAFEKWALVAGLPVQRRGLGVAYADLHTQSAWDGWRAATERAATICAAMGDASNVTYAGQGCVVAADKIREGDD